MVMHQDYYRSFEDNNEEPMLLDMDSYVQNGNIKEEELISRIYDVPKKFSFGKFFFYFYFW